MQSPELKDNPYNWVRFAFPWGQKNTPLEHKSGPREWQKEELLAIAEFIKNNKGLHHKQLETLVYKRAVSSGRGIGKSSLVAWIALWNISCQLGSSTIVSANTNDQLISKTFSEIGKWLALAINSYWFERTQTKIMPAAWLANGLKDARGIDNQYWYINGTLWNEDNPDAFAGAHNEMGELIIFDEASGIPPAIWNVSDGVFTEQTPYKFFMAYGNPRSNSGQFYDIFHGEHSRFWSTKKINSLSVEGIPQNTYKEIILKHGADSRDARVEVYGEFPEHGDKQFISRAVVMDATKRELEKADDFAALVMGVDIARFGDDETVIRFRQGRDARSIPPVIMRGMDNMVVANKCAELITKFNPDGVFIDAGAGSGVIDRLREMGYKVFEVEFGSKSEDPIWFDHRTELWARMRDWLGGAMLGWESAPDKKLIEDLVAPEYEYLGTEQKIKLESKDKMKKRLRKASPDNADALAVTFHAPIARKDRTAVRGSVNRRHRIAHGTGCDLKLD